MSRRADVVTGTGNCARNSRQGSDVGPASKRRRHATEANLIFLGVLLRRFPEWGIWLPIQGQWVAVRAREGGLPGENVPLVWVQASSASRLCAEMQKAERQLRDAAMRRARELAGMSGLRP
jgi:hypothetical protein